MCVCVCVSVDTLSKVAGGCQFLVFPGFYAVDVPLHNVV